MANGTPNPRLPERIGRLDELANNLWWSWHPQARELFRALDYPLWRMSGHNPVKQLREVSPDKLQVAAAGSDLPPVIVPLVKLDLKVLEPAV